ncbi:MAG: murein hydrolase activator EnvC family protein [Spirochaetaceae bacterium]
MRRAISRLIIVGVPTVAVLALLLVLGGWQWPASDFRVEESFAARNDWGVSPGVRLLSSNDPVTASASGEVVFIGTGPPGGGNGGADRGIPHGLGSFVVLEHEGGFRSLYGNLEEPRLEGKRVLAEGDVVGSIGRTGFSGGNTLGFRILDTEQQAYVNPMLLLPQLDDDVPPRVEDVVLTRGEKLWELEGEPEVTPGGAELRARIYDADGNGGPYRAPATVRSITVAMNDEETTAIELESLVDREGRLLLGESRPVQELYDEEGRVRLGSIEVGPGESRIEITARDHAGNKERVEFLLRGESSE